MNILIMAGGRAERLGGVVKPLLVICGKTILERVVSASRPLGRVVVAYTRHTKSVARECKRLGVGCIETSGGDYVSDLDEALSRTGLPALVLPCDTPFLTTSVLREFLEKALACNEDVITLEACRNGECKPLGISFFREKKGSWKTIRFEWRPELLDIDTEKDLEEARKYCAETHAST